MRSVRAVVKRQARTTRQFLERYWKNLLVLRERLKLSEETFHVIIAVIVGVIGGLTTLLYYVLNQGLKWALWGGTGDFLEIVDKVPLYHRMLLPAVGGVAAGLVLWLGLRLISNPGLSNLLEVVVASDGRLSLRAGLVNALSSLLSISTGASIGREGLIIQLSATLSSKLGQLARWPPYRLRLMVACGAAAGIAAGTNAPIAGAVFAAQIVLGNFSMNFFAPLLVSSVVAAIISRGVMGTEQWYTVPNYDFRSLTQLPYFLVLGFVCGVGGAFFLKFLTFVEKQIGRLPVPIYARLGLAGLAVGCISLLVPEVLGNGYGGTNEMLLKPLTLQFLAGLVIAKLLATSITVGAGTVGGIFTPTLFIGAAIGGLFGGTLHALNIGVALPTGAFAVVGMGSLLAATTHSPLLALIFIFELSLNYSIMPPLMLSAAIATLVSRRLHPASVYLEPLRRKGLDLQRESPRLGAATEKSVGDIMQLPVPPLRENTTFREIADRFLSSTNNFLPVVDGTQRLIGVVALHDMKEFLHAGQEMHGVIAYDLMRQPPACLTPNQKLSDVLPVLLASDLRNVPVVNSLLQYRLVGSVVRSEALSLLSDAISARFTTEE